MKDCDGKIYCKNLCNKHYLRLLKHGSPDIRGRKGLIPKIPICTVGDCNKKHYAKGLCCLHWTRFHRSGTTERRTTINKGKKCSIRYCGKEAFVGGLCSSHFYKQKHYGDPLAKGTNIKGKRNPRWNGGTSEYKNHYQLKKNRLVALKQSPKCYVCNNNAKFAVHIDSNKSNIVIDNLMTICKECFYRKRYRAYVNPIKDNKITHKGVYSKRKFKKSLVY